MKEFMVIYSKILDKATAMVGMFAGILLFIPALSVCYEVVMRGLFNAPTEWAIEISVYCVLVAGFLGLTVTYGAGKHISVDIFTNFCSAKTRTYLEVFTSFIGLLFSAIFVYEAWDMAMFSLLIERTSPSTLRVPLWIPQMSLPIGGGLLFFQFLRTLINDILKVQSGDYAVAAKNEAKAAGEGTK